MRWAGAQAVLALLMLIATPHAPLALLGPMDEANRQEEEFKATLMSAEQGDAAAQLKLGVMHEQGQGIARNYAKARSWYQKAAEQDHAEAKLALGVMCAEGRDGREACVQVLKWSVLSTAQGVRYATKLSDWVAAQMMVALFDEVKRLVAEWK